MGKVSLAPVAIAVLFVGLVVGNMEAQVSANKIKSLPTFPSRADPSTFSSARPDLLLHCYPRPSSPFILQLRSHQRLFLPLLRRIPCQYKATTRRHAQIRMQTKSHRAVLCPRLLPPMKLLAKFQLRRGPFPCALHGPLYLVPVGVPVEEDSLVFARIAAAPLLVGLPSKRRWPPLGTSCVHQWSWQVLMGPPQGLSSLSYSAKSLWSTVWDPRHFNASMGGGRWLLAIRIQWYVFYMQISSTSAGSCFGDVGKGTSYISCMLCTLLANKYGSGNIFLNVRADLRRESMLILRFNVEKSRVNILSSVKPIRYLRLKIPNPRRHRLVRQPRGARLYYRSATKRTSDVFGVAISRPGAFVRDITYACLI